MNTTPDAITKNSAEYATKLNPRKAAAKLVAQHRDQTGWLDEFAEHLDRARAGRSLSRTMQVWDLNQSQAAALFGVSRQAVSKWLDQGIPADRAVAIADLGAATDILVRYLKRERIPGVVRRNISAVRGQSLLDLFAAQKTDIVLQTCRNMFAFEYSQH